MNKETFIQQLKSRLTALDAQEVDDMMEEYQEYIEDKMADGATEEEAVAGFGNLDDLATEILSAYSDTPKTSTPKPTPPPSAPSSSNDALQGFFDGIGRFVKDASHALGDFYHSYLAPLSVAQVCRLLFIFILAIALVRIPLAIIQGIILGILHIFLYGVIYGAIKIVVDLVFELAYLVSLVVIAVSFYKSLTEEGNVDFSTLFKSPFKYFSGKSANNDQRTNETIDLVNDTINSTVTSASKAIEDIVARAKERTSTREQK